MAGKKDPTRPVVVQPTYDVAPRPPPVPAGTPQADLTRPPFDRPGLLHVS